MFRKGGFFALKQNFIKKASQKYFLTNYIFIFPFFWITCKCYLNYLIYFVFTIHHVNKHGVSRRWFTEADVKHFKIGTLRTITNITRCMVNWKKEFLHKCISKTLFIDTEQLSLQVFFKDFVDRFRTTYLKSGFIWNYFSKVVFLDFIMATNLKTGSSKKYSWKILFIDSKISTTKIIHLKVH